MELSGDQKRILAYAHAHGDRFTSREFQSVIKTDIYGASSAIKDMIRKGVACLPAKRGKVYVVREPLQATQDMPEQLVRLLPILRRKGRLGNKDARTVLGASRITTARLLKELVAAGWLNSTGKRGVGAFYSPGPSLLNQSPNAPKRPETGSMSPETDAMNP